MHISSLPAHGSGGVGVLLLHASCFPDRRQLVGAGAQVSNEANGRLLGINRVTIDRPYECEQPCTDVGLWIVI